MISAAVNSLSPDFSGLTAEISKSVSHIRAKAAAPHLNPPETAGTENVNGFQLNGCAVSYLEPQSLFAVQKFVSEAGEGEKLNRQPRQKNVFNEEGKNAPEIGQAETPVSFWEELASVADYSSFRQGLFAYGTAASETGNLFIMPGQETVSGAYAANAYDYVAGINSRPQVLIDFMHEFNRSFDYTI